MFEKYLQLGRDATSGGDRVMAESYFQHAEHYFRILNAMNQAAQANPQQQQGGQPGQQRRQQYEPQSNEPQGNEPQGNEQNGNEPQGDNGDRDDDDDQAAHGGGAHESRDIPIAAAPPEA